MSSISAGTGTGAGLLFASDTTGSLVLNANATTTVLTLNTSGAIGVGTSPSYGTAGEVLTTSGSNASPTWSSVQSPITLTTTGSSGNATFVGTTLNIPNYSGGGGNAATPTTLGTVYGRTPTSTSSATLFGNQTTNSHSGNGTTGIGFNSLNKLTGGSFNTALGASSLSSLVSGDQNTCIGASAGLSYTGSSTGNNTFVGYVAGAQVDSGKSNTFIGSGSGYAITSGVSNSALGISSMFTSTPSNTTNSTAIGSGSDVTGSNQIQLGDSGTTPYAYAVLQIRSDLRDKTDVRDTQLGLNFINALRPVDYKWDLREDYRPEKPENINDKEAMDVWRQTTKLSVLVKDGSKKRSRFHHGLIAQEVKSVLDSQGIDFGGYQDHKVKGGEDVLSIGYDELIAPLIKAIQELTDRIKVLEAR
jgi:hypothetical protein